MDNEWDGGYTRRRLEAEKKHMAKTPRLVETFQISEAGGAGVLTARELIALLQKAPPDAQVVVVPRGGSGSGEGLKKEHVKEFQLREDDPGDQSADVLSPSYLDGGTDELHEGTAVVFWMD